MKNRSTESLCKRLHTKWQLMILHVLGVPFLNLDFRLSIYVDNYVIIFMTSYCLEKGCSITNGCFTIIHMYHIDGTLVLLQCSPVQLVL